MLIYFSGLGSSPSKTIYELQSIRSALASSGVSFDSTLSLGPSVITNGLGIMLSAISSYQQMLTSSNQGNFSQFDLMRVFRMIIEIPSAYYFPSGFTFGMFQEMMNYWTLQMSLAYGLLLQHLAPH